MASCDYSTKLEETIAWLDDWIGQLEEAIADPPSGEEAERANQEMAIVQKLRGSYVSTRDELLEHRPNTLKNSCRIPSQLMKATTKPQPKPP